MHYRRRLFILEDGVNQKVVIYFIIDKLCAHMINAIKFVSINSDQNFTSIIHFKTSHI